jgi:hypothetical protein
MSLLGNIDELVRRATRGDAPDAEVHEAYDRVAEAVPADALADGLSHAFKSDQTPSFGRMISGLFHHSGPEQKAGLLNQLLGALSAAGVPRASGATGAPYGESVTPQVAAQTSPETVEAFAHEAAERDPSIIDKAAKFYAQHPALVRTIGAGALALLMSRISASRR